MSLKFPTHDELKIRGEIIRLKDGNGDRELALSLINRIDQLERVLQLDIMIVVTFFCSNHSDVADEIRSAFCNTIFWKNEEERNSEFEYAHILVPKSIGRTKRNEIPNSNTRVCWFQS